MTSFPLATIAVVFTAAFIWYMICNGNSDEEEQQRKEGDWEKTTK